jgi:hypothetical protein
MKCPLFILNDRRAQLGEETEIGDCIEAECAWYDDNVEECAVKSLPRIMAAIGNTIGELVKKIPKEFQFRDRG